DIERRLADVALRIDQQVTRTIRAEDVSVMQVAMQENGLGFMVEQFSKHGERSLQELQVHRTGTGVVAGNRPLERHVERRESRGRRGRRRIGPARRKQTRGYA